MRIKNLLYWLLVILLSVTMVISGYMVFRYLADSAQQKKEYDTLAELVEQARSDAASEVPLATTPQIPDDASSAHEVPEDASPAEAEGTSILPEYAPLYEKNSDLVGWMTIDGTPINYPVMQTPDRVDYYLHRSFEKKESSHGCLYVRESCDVFAPSDNLTIYGHHMKDGSMFASLDKYRKMEFWEEYPEIQFDTLYNRQTYTIFAVFKTTASVGEGFMYHRFEDAEDEAEFNQFVSTCKKLSFYDTGITPEYGDKMITLSTCEYSQDNGRLVVVAVRN
jgi:sortase B